MLVHSQLVAVLVLASAGRSASHKGVPAHLDVEEHVYEHGRGAHTGGARSPPRKAGEGSSGGGGDGRAHARRDAMRRLAREMLAGGIAEAVMDGVLYPIDTLKARQQAVVRTVTPKGAPRLPGQRRALLAMGNPFVGVVPVVLSAIPAAAGFMGVKFAMEMVAHQLTRTDTHGAGTTMLASGVADVCYWLFRFPLETGKKRVQVGADASTLGAMRRLLVEGGFKPAALYTGWRTVLWRDVPYDALEFGAYELARALLAQAARRGAVAAAAESRREEGAEAADAESALAGAFAALCAAVITTPLDCVRTRLITQPRGVAGATAYTGVLDCLAKMARYEGAASLFSGLGERSVIAGVGGAIWFVVYERLRIGHGSAGEWETSA